jgi:hypothetical protein
MTTRTMLFIILLAFAVTLAIVVGNRLSDASMAIVLGVAVGVAVGIPTSVVAAMMMTRQMAASLPAEYGMQAGSSNGNSSKPQPTHRPAPVERRRREVQPEVATSGRQFTVVGGASAPLLEEDVHGNGGYH